LKTSLTLTATSISDAVIASIPDRVKTASPQIQTRLVALKDAAVELTTHSGGVLINDPLVDLPAEVVGVVLQLPSLVLGYMEANEQTDPTGTLAKVENVLAAVKDLFYWSGKQAQVRSPTAPSDALITELKSKLADKEARTSIKGSLGNGGKTNGTSSAAARK